MQIEIDFEVFKALTSLRESESDSYNAVVRRLLALPTMPSSFANLDSGIRNALAGYSAKPKSGLFGTSRNALAPDESSGSILAGLLGGTWFGNIHFPNGTKFRATYKGRSYHAEIRNGLWIGEDGLTRTSPSDAARAITETNVNGWRFWLVQLPDDPTWRRLDELKQ